LTKVRKGNACYLTDKMAALLPFYSPIGLEAGLDEAGRGCLAGPVVAAAVILPRDFHHPFLTDSKQMTLRQRNELKRLVREYAIDFAIAEVDAAKIDEINILKSSILAMHLAVDQLKHRPEHLLVDGNRFYSYPLIPHTCIVKGDSKYFSIAAASILAKTHRDEIMEKAAIEHPGYGWERNAGYPTLQHRKAILENGLTILHRKTFKVEIK
jgi:ribonuclease HII